MKRALGWFVLAAIALVSIGYSLSIIGTAAVIDDAFISFRYARNFVDGYGLVYNVGERVEGYTNFLWTLISAAGIALDLDVLKFTQGLSLAMQVGTLALVFQLGRAENRSPGWALIAPLLLATQVSFGAYSMSGMETTFVTFLATAAFAFAARREHVKSSIDVGFVSVLFLLSLSRFDGLGLAVLILLAFRRDRRALLTDGIALLVLVAAYQVWRFLYYGSPLPNTFYAKVGFTPGRIFEGVQYIVDYVESSLGAHVPLLCLVPFLIGGVRRFVVAIALVVVGDLAYVAFVGGDWMPGGRFMLPVLPAIFLLMQEGLFVAHQRVAAIERPRLAQRLGILAMALALGLTAKPWLMSVISSQARAEAFDPGSNLGQVVADAPSVGRTLAEVLPPDASIAIEWGGIVPYQMPQDSLEYFGLTDRDIVAQNFPASPFGRWTSIEYLAERSPDVVVPCVKLFQSGAEAESAAEPGGFCGGYRDGFYFALEREELGYRSCVIETREQAFFVVLARECP